MFVEASYFKRSSADDLRKKRNKKIDKCGNKTDRKVCTVCFVIFDQQILVGKREKTTEEITMLGRRQLVKKNV